jgi:hypothetical protein
VGRIESMDGDSKLSDILYIYGRERERKELDAMHFLIFSNRFIVSVHCKCKSISFGIHNNEDDES